MFATIGPETQNRCWLWDSGVNCTVYVFRFWVLGAVTQGFEPRCLFAWERFGAQHHPAAGQLKMIVCNSSTKRPQTTNPAEAM